MMSFDDIALIALLFSMPIIGIYILNKLWSIALDGAIERWREYKIKREELYLESAAQKIERLIKLYVDEMKNKK